MVQTTKAMNIKEEAKNKAELWTKRTKTTLQAFEENIRRGCNRLVKA